MILWFENYYNFIFKFEEKKIESCGVTM